MACLSGDNPAGATLSLKKKKTVVFSSKHSQLEVEGRRNDLCLAAHADIVMSLAKDESAGAANGVAPEDVSMEVEESPLAGS